MPSPPSTNEPAANSRPISNGLRWARLVGVVFFLMLPLLLFGGVGAWTLYESGRLFWLSWAMPISWGVAWMLYRWWGADALKLTLPEPNPAQHWTPQDEAAAVIVQAEQQRLTSVTAEQLTEPKFYLDAASELSLKLARHYHPGAKDPLASLSVLEILAAVQLVSEDMEEWAEKYVPGSHLITVSQWKLLAQAPLWWQRITTAGWLASMVTNPLNIGRYVASQYTVNPVTNELKGQLLASFVTLYVRQVGYYLIEMNSGRLRGGAKKYRQRMRQMQRYSSGEPITITVPSVANADGLGAEPASTHPANDPDSLTVTIALVGQVKAGKSSLANALLGSQQAAVDVLPLTSAVQRYQLQVPGQPEKLVLLDTPGYADAALNDSQRKEIREAVRQADLVLFVLDARSPARSHDVRVLDDLTNWLKQNPQIKPPPILGVLTKIDGLSPVMEWSPPYDWQAPKRPKEISLRGAMDYNAETLGSAVKAIVPVCVRSQPGADAQRGLFGIEEFLWPAVAVLLDESRTCAVLRTIRADHDARGVRKVFSQLYDTGKNLWQAFIALEQARAQPVRDSLLKTDSPRHNPPK